MWFNFFRRRHRGRPLRLDLPDPVDVMEVVLIACGPDDVPTSEGILELVKDALPGLVPEPIGPMLFHWVEKGLLQVRVSPRASSPPLPPKEILRHFGLGEEEETRLDAATHVVLLHSPDRLMRPRLGLWAVLAAARAVAEHHGGVVFDTTLLKILPIDVDDFPIPGDGATRAARHLAVPFSVNEKGLGWITTKGMSKFGLPELEVRDGPPNLPASLAPLVCGVASRLIEESMDAAENSGGPLKVWEVGPEIRVDAADIARAYGGEPGEPADGVRGWTSVGLELHRTRGDGDDFIALVPPAHFPRSQGEWLYSALGDIVGRGEDDVYQVPPDHDAMERAHARAMETLPSIRERFRRGLGLGEQLFIKHGFPVEGGGHEHMWIAVNTWSGDRISGQLANQPAYRLDLEAGQVVELAEGEVFDWYLTRPDGEHEGGFTNEPATKGERLQGGDEPESDDGQD